MARKEPEQWPDRANINIWLNAAREGRPLAIDTPNVKEMLREEIAFIRYTSNQRIKAINALLRNRKYFKKSS